MANTVTTNYIQKVNNSKCHFNLADLFKYIQYEILGIFELNYMNSSTYIKYIYMFKKSKYM